MHKYGKRKGKWVPSGPDSWDWHRNAPEPVIIRVDGKRTKSPAPLNKIWVLFAENSITSDPGVLWYYSSGGNGEVWEDDIKASTRPATAEEQARVLANLATLGRKPVRVVKRLTAAHRAARQAEIDETYE